MPLSRAITSVGARLTLTLLILAVSVQPVRAQSADASRLDAISSQRYIVVDSATGEVFAEKDADVRGGMASLTKVFTAIIAIERAPLNLPITADESDEFDSTSTRMTGFFAGTTYSVEDLIYGMLLESGNDAAHALARGIGYVEGDTPDQSVARFVGWMNDKVAELGLTNTHFVNPHGLSDPDHYSTPREIAAFMMYASQNNAFMTIITARNYVTTTGSTLTSVNRGPEFIPSYIGGKTGFDEETGYCLIEIGQEDDARLISVTIDGVAPATWYEDHAILLEYGFAARADRLAAGDPIGNDVVAFAQPTEPPVEQQPIAEDVTATAQSVAAAIEDGPGPVRIYGTPLPVVDSGDGEDSNAGNWLIGFLVLVIVLGSLAFRAGVRPRRSPERAEPDTSEPDTTSDEQP